MAALGSTTTTAVPEGFLYETKYIVLSYLGLLPAYRLQASAAGQGGDSQPSAGGGDGEREKNRAIRGQIEEELRKLEDDISASFSSTGFDRHTSPVFHPIDPENSIEDCLGALGDGVSRDLGSYLATVVHSLLTGPLDYQTFRDACLDVSTHTQGGWNQVLVPLVVMQELHAEGQALDTLVPLGVRFLEETEADYIIQSGGWGAVFHLEEEEDHQAPLIAEDSNDIYILSGGEQQPSPPSSLLCADTVDGSWQTESLPASLAGHESWAQVGGIMDPEDVKSLDSMEGVALAEERSENNSSNSDIVHVEREELLEAGGAEEEEEEPGLQESMMSVLGTESDLAELRAEFRDHTPTPPPLAPSSETESSAPASLVSLEESVVIVDVPPVVSSSAEPSLAASEPGPLLATEAAAAPEPEPPAPLPVPALEPDPEPQAAAAAAAPEPLQAAPPSPAKEDPPAALVEPEPAVVAPPPPLQETVPEPEAVPLLVAPPEAPPMVEPPAAEAHPAAAEPPPVQTEPEPESELPVLLYGGAALVALAALAIYGALTYRRK